MLIFSCLYLLLPYLGHPNPRVVLFIRASDLWCQPQSQPDREGVEKGPGQKWHDRGSMEARFVNDFRQLASTGTFFRKLAFPPHPGVGSR